jgi:hypothetical protein
MARRVLRKFLLTEISGVRVPASVPSRAAIMKSADGAKEHLNMAIDNEALALKVLDRAAEAIRKNNPSLSREQAFAQAFSDPDNRVAALVEREASAKRLLAGAPVARTAAHVLDSLDDNSINALTVEIKNANPFLDDAGIVRLLIQRVEAADVGKALSDGDLQRMVDYERRINPTLSDEAVYRRVAASHAVRVDRREFRGEMEAARRDDAMSAIEVKADELRAADPSLTKEMAFAAAYSDPKNRELAKAERRANRPEG